MIRRTSTTEKPNQNQLFINHWTEHTRPMHYGNSMHYHHWYMEQRMYSTAKYELRQQKSTQMNISKRSMGLHKWTSTTAARTICRWQFIEVEIHTGWIGYWAQIHTMDELRWPKIILPYMTQMTDALPWYQKVKHLMTKYGIPPPHTTQPTGIWCKGVQHQILVEYWTQHYQQAMKKLFQQVRLNSCW